MKKRKSSYDLWPSGRAICGVICLLLTTVSCSYFRRVSRTKKSPKAPVEATGPIISMLTADAIDDKGHVVGPKFSFAQDASQITVIVHLGKISGTQLKVSWYRTTENGDEKLFEHTILVKNYDRAFSIAKNSGNQLTSGTYKVVASIDGQSAEVNWQVLQAKVAASQLRPNLFDGHKEIAEASPFQLIAFMQTGTVARSEQNANGGEGDPPVAGTSGTRAPFVAPSGMCIGGGDDEGCGRNIIDSTSDTVSIYIFNPSKLALNVSASANSSFGPTRVGTTNQDETEFLVDPCSMPGDVASDLPGKKIMFDAAASNGSEVEQTTATLGDDTSAPRLKVTSTPERSTKVKAGDKIKIKVTATEASSGGSWQTGVKVIQITAEPGGLIKDPWVNSAKLPKPCLEKTWEQDDEATYTVPNNPPPIIKICALAEDYVGNQATPACVRFPTGNLWKGTMRSTVTANFENYACSSVFEATLGVVETGNELEGDGRATYSSSTCRQGPVPRCEAMNFELKGHAFSDRLEINFVKWEGVPSKCVNWGFAAGYFGTPHPGQTLVVPIGPPGNANAQTSSNWTNGKNQYSTTDTTQLKCDTCAH